MQRVTLVLALVQRVTLVLVLVFVQRIIYSGSGLGAQSYSVTPFTKNPLNFSKQFKY